jgi:pyridoxal phosphate enzyme (YggS family)
MSLAAVRRRLESALERSGRRPGEVQLLVVSKGHSIEEILGVYQQGQRDFGENRAQELAGKVGKLPADIRWHFVGALQSNKVRLVRPSVDLLHSFDRIELGPTWLKGPGNAPPVLLQINIGEEPQKHGIAPSDVAPAVRATRDLGIDLRGVMAMAPIGRHSEEARPYFRRLKQLAEEVREICPVAIEVSMGMTDDFEVAIEEGSTMIRVGRAIFAED